MRTQNFSIRIGLSNGVNHATKKCLDQTSALHKAQQALSTIHIHHIRQVFCVKYTEYW